MMKYLIYSIVSIALSLVLSNYCPWWIVSIITGVAAFFLSLKGRWAFLIGLLSIGLTWGITAFLIDQSNHQILSQKIGVIFGGINSTTLLCLSFLIGGIAGGLGGLCGSWLHRSLKS